MASNEQMDILVTGGEEKQGLAITRSLGKRGIKVLLGGSEKHSIGFYSRYVTKTFIYPSQHKNMEGFVKKVLEKAIEFKVPLIFPALESTLVCLDRYRDEVEKVTRLIAPSSEILELAIDKTKTLEIADRLKIPYPKTYQVNSLDEAIDAARQLKYPVAMKPIGSRYHARLPGKLNFKVLYAGSEKDLIQKLNIFCSEGVYPIIQEFCPGQTHTFVAVVNRGKPLGYYQTHISRLLPITGGVGVIRESVSPHPKIKEYSFALFKELNWTGPLLSEFRFNPVNGSLYLFEVNSRIPASIAMAEMIGVNVPLMVYELFSSGKEICIDSYKIGLRCRWLRGDIRSVWKYCSGETTRQFIDHPMHLLPARSKLLWEFFKDFRPSTYYDIESISDPLPGLMETKNIFKECVNLTRESLRKSLVNDNDSYPG